MGMHHHLSAHRSNLHGIFDKGIPPVLWVESGDLISFETLEVGWRTERVVPGHELARISPLDPVRDNGPALTGPVGVRGSAPSMTLEISFLEFRPADWGWTSAGGPNTTMPGVGVEAEKASLFWDLDKTAGIARNQVGQEVTISPFLGTVGLASADNETSPGWKPHPRTAGNIDATVLIAGSTLYLPIEVEGALLSVGDGHACQGDGELAGTAIECPMEEALIRVVLHPEMTISGPRAFTAQGEWVTFGLAETLDLAAVLAINSMLDLIVERTSWTRSQALAFSTTTVNLRVTQMVNPLKGIHAVLNKNSLPELD